MIAALLLSGFGELERAGIVEGHEDVEDSAQYMGCGVPAVSDNRRWDVETFWDEMALYGHTRGNVGALAEERWPYSMFGGVFDVLGWLWPGCPHRVLVDATPAEIATAQHALELRRMADAGAASMMGQLTAAGSELLGIADKYWKHLQNVHAKRLADQRRAAAKAKGR